MLYSLMAVMELTCTACGSLSGMAMVCVCWGQMGLCVNLLKTCSMPCMKSFYSVILQKHS